MTQKDIEKLIEEKVEERTSNLKQKIKEQQKEIESLKKYSKANQRNNNRKERISRRSFLKKLGAGAVGLGALSLSPVSSSMKITSDNIYKDGTAIDQGGIFDLQNYLKLDGTNSMTGDLTIKENTALHAGNLSNYDATQFSGNNGTNGQILQTDGNNTSWSTIDTSAPVDSVNGQTGSVSLNYNDVGAKSDSYSAPVDDVNGQTGSVNVSAGISASDLTNESGSDTMPESGTGTFSTSVSFSTNFDAITGITVGINHDYYYQAQRGEAWVNSISTSGANIGYITYESDSTLHWTVFGVA